MGRFLEPLVVRTHAELNRANSQYDVANETALDCKLTMTLNSP